MGTHTKPLLDQTARAWLYRITTAAIPLLMAYGILDGATAPLWIALAASVLATGTATAHTPTRRRP